MKKRIVSLFLASLILLTSISGNLKLEAAETPDEFDLLRQKWYNMAVGGDYDETDSRLQPMIQSINDVAQNYWDSMNKNPVCNAIDGYYLNTEGAGDSSQDYLWDEYPLGRRQNSRMDSYSIHLSYQFIRAMALAHETKGAELYKNEALRKDILNALEYLYTNHFRPGITKYANWFAWEIGASIYLNESAILMYDYLDAESIEKYAIASRNWGSSQTGGANGLWNLRADTYAAILLKDDSKMTAVKNKIPNFLSYVTSYDGYYTDGTYIAHGGLVYNGGYGYTQISETCHLLYMLHDSTWQVNDSRANNVFKWIYDSYEPIVYKGLLMDAFRSRESARKDMKQVDAAIIVANAIVMAMEMASEEDAANFKAILKEWYANNPYAMENLQNSAELPWHKFPLDTVVKVVNAIDDEAITARDIKNKNYQFPVGARSVHFTTDYAYVVAMANQKIHHYEIVDVNSEGWNTGSGMTFIYNNDRERYDGLNKPTIDWNRLPGTTSIYDTQIVQQKAGGGWAGGTSIDQKYGMSSMQLAPPMLDANIKFNAKKSWFMFDDEIVALGTDISAESSDNKTETTFENYMIEGNNKLIVNGNESLESHGQATIESVSYMNIEGNVDNSNLGIYFPQPEKVEAVRETRSGKWTDLKNNEGNGSYNTDDKLYSADFLTLWKDHGTNPTDEKYAYVLLPNQDVANTQAYASNSDVEIISNDKQVQAVYEKNLDIIGATFWSDKETSIDVKGIENYLTVDQPATVMIKEALDTNTMDISIADITQTNTNPITLEIYRTADSVITQDSTIEVVQMSPTIKLKVTPNGTKGVTQKVQLSFAPTPAPAQTEILSHEMVGDKLSVSLKAVDYADGYILRYGTTTGTYIHEIISSAPEFNVPGLDLGQLYYFSAVAFNGTGEGDASVEAQITLPATTQFVDELVNTNLMLEHDNLAFDTSSPEKYNGDTSRLQRVTTEVGYAVYELPKLLNFTLDTYYNNYRKGTVKVYVSPNGKDWTDIAFTETPITSSTGWTGKRLTPQDVLEEGMNYLKIELSEGAMQWSPQVGTFSATMTISNTKDKSLIDTLIDTTKTFSANGITLSDGKAIANSEGGTLIYSMTEIGGVTVTADGSTNVYTSTDGESYSLLSDLNNPPAGTNYIKLQLASNTQVSQVQIDYTNNMAYIQKLRFEDMDTLLAVGYEANPVIKRAPMNAVGELVYTSDDEEIATYGSDKITPHKSGNTTLRASVFGNSAVSTSIPIAVFDNAAQGKIATAVDSNSSYLASNAFDGDLSATSRWESPETGLAEIKVDLGGPTNINNIDFFWDSIGGAYKVEVSSNDDDWTLLQTVSDTSKKYMRVNAPEATKARYVKMTGLVSDTIYGVIEMRVINIGGAGDPVEPGDPTKFVDECEDNSLMLRSENLIFETDATGNNYHGDKTAMLRPNTDVAYAVYELPKIEMFTLETYHNINQPGAVKVFGSSDGNSWNEIEVAAQEYAPISVWKRITLTPAATLGESINYLKVELSGTARSIAPKVASLNATMKPVLIDNFENTDVMLESENLFYDQDATGTNYNGDITLIRRTTTAQGSGISGYAVYSVPNLEAFTLEAHYNNNQKGLIKIYKSSDGSSWHNIDIEQDEIARVGVWNTQRITPTESLDQDANYLKIELSEGGKEWSPKLGILTATMNNSNKPEPIIEITVDRSALSLDQAESYQLNASVTTSSAITIDWSSSQPSIATVDENGLVKGVAAGNATITAKIGDVEASCEVTVVELPTEPVDPTKLIDNFENTDVMLESENLFYDQDATGTNYNGDITLIRRTTTAQGSGISGYAVYSVPNLEAFTLEAHYNNNQKGLIKIYKSSDGSSWHNIDIEQEEIARVGVWNTQRITPTESLDQDANYLKIELSEGGKEWSPKLGILTATMNNSNKPEPIIEITVDRSALSLDQAESYQLNASVTTSSAITIDWSSSQPSIATVDENGLVKGVAAGNATITAKIGDVEASCEVTVVAIPTEPEASIQISLDKPALSLDQAESYQLNATVTTSSAITIDWSSSQPSIATVDVNGLVKGIAPGNATITAKIGDAQASCKVTVINSQLSSGDDGNNKNSGNTKSSIEFDNAVKPENIAINQKDVIVTITKEKYRFTPSIERNLILNNQSKRIIIKTDDIKVVIAPGVMTSSDRINNYVIETSKNGNVVQFTDKNGKTSIVKLSLVNGGMISYIAENSGTYQLIDNTKIFNDTTEHWAGKAIEFTTSRELFNGTKKNNFSPNATMTRGMLVTVLHRLAGEKEEDKTTFMDIQPTDYFANAVSWADSNNIAVGVGEGKFSPEQDVTRQQIAVMLYNYARLIGMDTSEQQNKIEVFSDGAMTSSWANVQMNWMIENNIISGKPGNILDPKGKITRAEVAVILERFVEKVVR